MYEGVDEYFKIVGVPNTEVANNLKNQEDFRDAYFTDYRTAELFKLACNAFHATKATFANEINKIAGKAGANGAEVMNMLRRFDPLSVGDAYLEPRDGNIDGACLPKDLQGLIGFAIEHGYVAPLLRGVKEANAL